MSVIRIAVRIAARQALLGRTHVGDNVLDSKLGALDITSDGELRDVNQKKPFIAIYTDASRAGQIEGAPDSAFLHSRAFTPNGATEIVFEAGVSAAMVETDLDTDQSYLVGIGIAPTDAGLEFQLDLLARQIGDALTDPDSEWADIYRSLAGRTLRIERARDGSAENGGRKAAHQIRVTTELVEDPVLGVPLEPASPFARFLDAAEALTDATLSKQVQLLRALFDVPADPEWKAHQRQRGLTRDELQALGLGPVEQDLERTTPPFTRSTVDVEGAGTVEVEP